MCNYLISEDEDGRKYCATLLITSFALIGNNSDKNSRKQQHKTFIIINRYVINDIIKCCCSQSAGSLFMFFRVNPRRYIILAHFPPISNTYFYVMNCEYEMKGNVLEQGARVILSFVL